MRAVWCFLGKSLGLGSLPDPRPPALGGWREDATFFSEHVCLFSLMGVTKVVARW